MCLVYRIPAIICLTLTPGGYAAEKQIPISQIPISQH